MGHVFLLSGDFPLLRMKHGQNDHFWRYMDSAAVAGTIQIGEAAKLTALSIDAIRLYERRALLPKVPGTPRPIPVVTPPMTSPV